MKHSIWDLGILRGQDAVGNGMQKEERTLQKTMRARVIVRVLVGYDLNSDGGGNYSLATARRSVPHPASEDRIDDGRGSHPVRFWSVVVGSLLH